MEMCSATRTVTRIQWGGRRGVSRRRSAMAAGVGEARWRALNRSAPKQRIFGSQMELNHFATNARFGSAQPAGNPRDCLTAVQQRYQAAYILVCPWACEGSSHRSNATEKSDSQKLNSTRSNGQPEASARGRICQSLLLTRQDNSGTVRWFGFSRNIVLRYVRVVAVAWRLRPSERVLMRVQLMYRPTIAPFRFFRTA